MYNNPHTFHIPVLGLGYSLDTPAKVAQYGISSVISLVDDLLMEKMREFHCMKLNLPFSGISNKIEDYRAKRITAYLDLMQDITRKKFDQLKESIQQKESELYKYIDMLPEMSDIKKKFHQMMDMEGVKQRMTDWINENLRMGEIDVNIMSKIDRPKVVNGEQLPEQYNDAHAALRGFANSKLTSSLVLSAGMNPRLYGYLEEFEDFYPDVNGELKKRITLKVSDYRSALIQGRFLAKKGIWVSEYRVESGLNCGGHAFASDGYLLGPVLEEFKQNRAELINSVHEIYKKALLEKNKPCPDKPYQIKITAQGGVGTAKEHQFLIDHYGLDSVGWGTPFMLVPEAVNIDQQTLELLSNAKEEDLYLSDISPLGVRFNNVRGNTKDLEKEQLAMTKSPGFSCTKKFLALYNEFGLEGVCTASKQYVKQKIQELRGKNLSETEYNVEYRKATQKACLCNGLVASSLLSNQLDTSVIGPQVSVCPGPNMAYFSRPVSLNEMVGHIYGRNNIIERHDRPNMFLKELKMYIDYLSDRIDETLKPVSDKQKKAFETFHENLSKGIEYYKDLFKTNKKKMEESGLSINIKEELNKLEKELIGIKPKLV